MKKKFLSFVLAGTLALGLSTTAAAAGYPYSFKNSRGDTFTFSEVIVTNETRKFYMDTMGAIYGGDRDIRLITLAPGSTVTVQPAGTYKPYANEYLLHEQHGWNDYPMERALVSGPVEQLFKYTTSALSIDGEGGYFVLGDGTEVVPTVAPSKCPVTLNGENIDLNAYLFLDENGGGSNYVMLRDVATILNGTSAQFEVQWDAAKGIVLTKGQPYTPVGGEMVSKGEDAKVYMPNAARVWVDQGTVFLDSYTIEGNNYFKLRDLGEKLGFGVEWNAETGTVELITG